MEVYENTFERREREKLAQVMINIIAKRPLLDLGMLSVLASFLSDRRVRLRVCRFELLHGKLRLRNRDARVGMQTCSGHHAVND